MAIITSLLDTDLYKFTMMQVVFHQHPSAQVKYAFKCRTKGANLQTIFTRLEAELDALCELRFTKGELDYLAGLRFIKRDFVNYLRLFKLQREHVKVTQTSDGIDIRIDGPWLNTILFEVPVLSMVNQLAYENTSGASEMAVGDLKLDEKIKKLKTLPPTTTFKMSDFGTRRRWSKDWQRHVVERLAKEAPHVFTGTSNVLLAKDIGLIPIGTMAHEYLQAFQALGVGRLVDSQIHAFEAWAKEYRGDLGIALTDVIGLEAFLADFDMYFCKLFDGVRHDSGDPAVWAARIIEHYKNNKVDPATKQLVFSDGLTVDSAMALHKQFDGQAKLFFGIGTHLTHDVGLTPLNVVLKMVECNDAPVAKLSDSPGKTMCEDDKYVEYLVSVFDKKVKTHAKNKSES
jgi:nicotinate phosphoribosyltransferase